MSENLGSMLMHSRMTKLALTASSLKQQVLNLITLLLPLTAMSMYQILTPDSGIATGMPKLAIKLTLSSTTGESTKKASPDGTTRES